MSKFKKVIFSLVLLVPVIGLAGCKQEGPMERAGEKVDQAVEDAGQAIKEAGENLDEKKN